MELAPKGIFRSCSFQEAFDISPWPARIVGSEKWEKTSRNVEDVLAEYEENWYRPLLARWAEFSADRKKAISIADALRFYRLIDGEINASIEKNRAVYRSTVEDYLLSAGDELLRGNLNAAMHLHEWLIDSHILGSASRERCATIVELGCGNGKHVVRLASSPLIVRARAGDICPSAVTLGNRVSADVGLPIEFVPFDFYKVGSYAAITKELDDYLVYTQHAVEQLPRAEGVLVEALLSLPNPPACVVHLEPIDFGDGSGFSQLCAQYARMNRYNVDLWPVLQAAERDGRIEIAHVVKRAWGISAFNPTSVVVWKPRRKVPRP